MFLKKLMLSVCLSSALFVPTCVWAEHSVNDSEEISLTDSDLAEMLLGHLEEELMLDEMEEMNSSIGDPNDSNSSSVIPSEMDQMLEVGGQDKGSDFAAYAETTATDEMKKVGLSKESFKDADKIQEIMMNKVMPTTRGTSLSDAELAMRARIRRDIEQSAVSDVYANAVTYLMESTKAQDEKVKPAVKLAGSKKTLLEKQDAANEIGILRLRELIEGNRLAAENLKSESADSVSSLLLYEEREKTDES